MRVLGGASMPFIIRKEKEYFRSIVECYVDGIMDDQEVEAARKSFSLLDPCVALPGPFDIELLLEKLFIFDEAPSGAREMLKMVERNVVDLTIREYGILRESTIELR